ncbi:BTB/POZ domain-containing protein At5g41330-like [Ananas comosus]|uniref:BTB/POZ domain-containing protein At5g41330-like n=1 Tax=Ananas comosus TaxID=4615 RepID=A0A6P5FCX2_ANACO|nr:BTB/POZ domain-containing protein At5g41330-like [Ananas comosus]
MPPPTDPPNPNPNPNPKPSPANSVVTINVGGELFQTTAETLALAGPASSLSSLSSSAAVPFLDRDPRIFSLLLSFLRLRRAPSAASASDLDDLLSEARFFSLPPDLLSLLSSSLPSPAASPLRHLRHLRALASPRRRRLLLRPPPPPPPPPAPPSPPPPSTPPRPSPPSPPPAPRLSRPPPPSPPPPPLPPSPPLRVLHWLPNPSTNSTVLAVAASPDALFVSFESSRRNASAVLAYDLNSFDPVLEVGRKEIFGAELDSAIPATKLRWVAEFGLLMAAGSHAGPSGLSGNIALWDIRSNKAAWEITEKSIDCFADVAVSDGLRAMFKVGVNSGEVFMADLRKLGAEEPWVCLGDRRKVETGKREGSGCLIECYGQHVFCTRGGEVEFWTEVVFGGRREGFLEEERVMRKNWMGRAKDRGGKKITHLAFGGSRMVLARKDEQSVEVWESCTRGI